MDPATLNWHKDSDACWLYGPFHAHTINELERQVKHMAQQDLQCQNSLLKSALKKSDPADVLQLFRREHFTRTTSDDILVGRVSKPPLSPTTTPPPVMGQFFFNDSPTPVSASKHIRFSHFVDQRMILDKEQVDAIFDELELKESIQSVLETRSTLKRVNGSQTNLKDMNESCQDNEKRVNNSVLISESQLMVEMQQDKKFILCHSSESSDSDLSKSLTTVPMPPTHLNDESPLTLLHARKNNVRPIVKDNNCGYGFIHQVADTVTNTLDIVRFATSWMTRGSFF